MLLKLTLDTNCIINLLDFDSTTATSVEELTTLMRHALEGKANLCVTTALGRDLERDSNDERRGEMLQKVAMFPTIGGVFRLDATKLGGPDVLASEDQKKMAFGIQSLLFPGLSPEDKRYQNKIADVDHLVGHKLNRRDLFVTDDNGILAKADALEGEYGIRVLTPAGAVEMLDRTINLALVAEDFRGAFEEISRLIVAAAESDSWSPKDEAAYQQRREFLLRTFSRIRERFSGFRHSQGVNLQVLAHNPNPFRIFYERERGAEEVSSLLAESSRRAGFQLDNLQWLRSEASRLRTLLIEFVGDVEGE